MRFKKKFLSSVIALGLSTSSMFISNANSQQLEVNHINVGQDESLYTELPYGSNILSNAGKSNYGSTVVNYLKEQEKNIDIKTNGDTATINGNNIDILGIPNDINGHWAEHQIKDFINKGYLNGYPNGTFKPQASIKRAEFVKVLNKVFGLTTKSGIVFSDTTKHWAKDEIDIAVTNGVCQGTSVTTFEPDAPITREAAAKMIANYKKISDTHHDKINGYNDGYQTADWAIDEVEAILEAGYMNGYSNTNTFKPKNNITRAEAVVTLGRVDVNQNTQINISEYQQEVIRLVNIERVKFGLSELKSNDLLTDIATLKSEDMVNKNYFSHTSPTYGSPFDMMKKFGVIYRVAGENLAKGYTTPSDVVTGWMNSEGHRKNILNERFTEIGIGVVESPSTSQLYWTQMFIG